MTVSCTTINNAITEKSKHIEYYRIFDIKTSADRFSIAKAASAGLSNNTSDINENMPIPENAEPPEKPGRFKLINPFKGSQIGAFVAAGGASGFKVATCDGSAWSANSDRTIPNSSNSRFTACLFEYKDGYHLDMFASFQKKEGGVMQLSRSLAAAMVGTPEEWVEKTFLDVAREVHKSTDSEITFIEGFPPVQGTPWLDSGETFSGVPEK